jgi:hypothetical protein
MTVSGLAGSKFEVFETFGLSDSEGLGRGCKAMVVVDVVDMVLDFLSSTKSKTQVLFSTVLLRVFQKHEAIRKDYVILLKWILVCLLLSSSAYQPGPRRSRGRHCTLLRLQFKSRSTLLFTISKAPIRECVLAVSPTWQALGGRCEAYAALHQETSSRLLEVLYRKQLQFKASIVAVSLTRQKL